MEKKINRELLSEQLETLKAALRVLEESYERVGKVLTKKGVQLTVEERESCEALTARFARLYDFLFQRVFRTLDQIELQDEGTGLDRLNRMEKRNIIESTKLWKELRELRNEIAHEYLIEEFDRALKDAHRHTPVLRYAVEKLLHYIQTKGYLK